MHDSQAIINVGQKSAQMGYTEWALNTVFYYIDVKRMDCLYVLPAKTPDAKDFSAGRFDPALEASPYLRSLFSDVKNVGHKMAGNANLYVRGSRSRSGLKSVPTGLVILDELDEMNQKHVPLALERTSGQEEKRILMISTPTLDDMGINQYYNSSSKEQFFFKCPSCSRLTQLIFPECVEITAETINDPGIENSFYKCKECKGRLANETKFQWLETGRWVPERTNKDVRGFHINQLYSPTISPVEIARHYFLSYTDPTLEQEFYNSKLGKTHVVKDARITDKQIADCTGTYSSYAFRPKSSSDLFFTMGVDVGSFLHVEIDGWDKNYLPRVLAVHELTQFEELDQLMTDYGIHFCVIDANPERRKALEFATRFSGFVKLCFYGRGVNGRTIHENSVDEMSITVDRTSWLDLSLGRFKRGKITIPCDTGFKYKEQLKAPVRKYEKDADGNPVGRYISGTAADHYAHARNYAEIALSFTSYLHGNQDLKIDL